MRKKAKKLSDVPAAPGEQPQKQKNRRRSLTGVIALGFLGVILLGTVLLCTPFASASGRWTRPLTAMFTAVSATCVTGLTVVETGTFWSPFGQTVIICMIQIGGLGFMSLAVLLSLVIRRRVSPQERMLLAMSYGLDDLGGMGQLLKKIIGGTLIIELAGAAALCARFIPLYGTKKGILFSLFHSISAFCNAGFDILGNGDSVSVFARDPLVSITLMLLVLLGGIGFPVWNDIVSRRVRSHRLTVYSRFVLWMTGILLFSGALIYALFEWNNPDTIGNFGVGDKILNCFFQSVTWRTAGFYTVDNAVMHDGTKLTGLLYMFIGGASSSTAGGVKMVTVGVLVLAVCSIAAGKRDVNIFHRRVSGDNVMRAMTVVAVQVALEFVGALAVSACTDASLPDVLYEVVSAGGTVGISAGLTPSLPAPALCVIMLLMYFGRVGILTVTYAVMVNLNENKTYISYPDANLLIG